MQHYRAFGLSIASALALPHMRVTHDPADVIWQLGTVPEHLPQADHIDDRYEVNQEQYLFKVPQVARFLSRGGEEIIIDAEPDADMGRVRSFLLAYPLAALLHQRGYTLLHGSAFYTGNGVIAIMGASGAGKSTLAAAFVSSGLSLLTDEFCAIRFDDAGQPLVYPAHPHLRLWRDSLVRMGRSIDDAQRIYPTLEKYYLPVPDQFYDRPARLTHLYELVPQDSPTYSIEAIAPLDRVPILHRHLFLRQSMVGQGITGDVLQNLAVIARQATLYRVMRSSSLTALDNMVRDIRAHWR